MVNKVRKLPYTLLGIVIVVVMLFPLYWAIVTSLENEQQLFQHPPSFYPPTPTLSHYVEAFTTQLPHIETSCIVALGTVLVTLLIAVPSAYALAHFRFRVTFVFVFVLLLTQMIPNIILASSLFVIFQKINLLNSYWGLILADCTHAIPFNILILRAFMASIPFEITEAAMIDGASEWQTFLKVIVPVSKSGIITAALFSFLFSWGDFIFALTMMTKNVTQPITVSIYSYIGQYSQDWNGMMASAVLASIPAAILLIICQKNITAGLTSGSLKG